MNVKNVLGIYKIDNRGLCVEYRKFKKAKKQFDPQLIAGFFYAINNFTNDYFGEKLMTLNTRNYKIIFKKDGHSLIVYIVDNKLDNYELLESELSCECQIF
ncbi:MAG: hypothetical protein ACTSUG_17320 [Candidatus Helarchaeota archaeon]